MPRVIAIDGPSASGKSSTASAVAHRMGWAHLDSGALYRGVALVAHRFLGAKPGDPIDPNALLLAAARRGLALHHDGTGFAPYLDGQPIEQEIRSEAVTALVSPVAAMPEVRTWVTERLRSLARAGQPLVVDGRDIGTVVFPDAGLKVYLAASPRTRAERRLRQRGETLDAERVEREARLLAARDEADSRRAVAPLRVAGDAVAVDGTNLSFEEQVSQIVELAQARGL